MSDAHAGFGMPEGQWRQLAQGVQGATDGHWRRLAEAYDKPVAPPDIYADLRDIMAKLAAREDADRTAMVVFIAAYYGWRLES